MAVISHLLFFKAITLREEIGRHRREITPSQSRFDDFFFREIAFDETDSIDATSLIKPSDGESGILIRQFVHINIPKTISETLRKMELSIVEETFHRDP